MASTVAIFFFLRGKDYQIKRYILITSMKYKKKTIQNPCNLTEVKRET